jgi:site-specific recombinase XerD
MSPPARGSVALFLDMLAAERGASANTLEAYGRDLADYEDFLASIRARVADNGTGEIRAYLADLTRRGHRHGERGAPSLGDPATAPLPLSRRLSRRGSRRRAGGA